MRMLSKSDESRDVRTKTGMSETRLGIGTTSSGADATALNCDDGGHRGQPELLRVPGGQGHPRCAFVPRPPARCADGFVVTTNRRIVDADNSDADARLPTQLPQAIPGTSTPRGISSSPSRAIPRTRATTRALRRSARRRRTSPPTPSPRRSTRSRTRRTRHPPTKSPTVPAAATGSPPRARAAPPRSPSSRVPPTLTSYASRACEAASFDPRNPPDRRRGWTPPAPPPLASTTSRATNETSAPTLSPARPRRTPRVSVRVCLSARPPPTSISERRARRDTSPDTRVSSPPPRITTRR